MAELSSSRLRTVALLAASYLGAWSVDNLRAQASDVAGDQSLPRELQSELDALLKPGWIISGSAKLAAGYRDNVLLSAFDAAGRGFVDGQVETLALRPAESAWEYVAFLNADVLRYISPLPGANGEQQWFGQGEVRWIPDSRVRAGFSLQGYYQDMVVDLSETEAQRVIAPIKARGVMAAVSSRVLLPWHVSLEPAVQEHLSDYLDYTGDYRELKSGTRLEWKKWEWLALSGAWFHHERKYKDRPDYTAGGRALPGTRLNFSQEEGELKASSAFAGAGKWTMSASVGRLSNRDGASGYFDYTRKQAKLAIGWSYGAWNVNAEGTAQRFDYLVQTVGIGISPPPRVADNFDTLLRVERRLGRHWTAFAEGRWERNRSNEAEFDYHGSTALAGVGREF